MSPLACGGSTTPAEPSSGWPHPNFDPHGTRATFRSTISGDRVGDLREHWRYELPAGAPFGGAATTPVIVDGTVFAGDLLTNVHAVDLASGERQWFAEVDSPVFGPSGVAVDSGRVFANFRGTGIAAYDSAGGSKLWDTGLLVNGGQVNIQPVVADGIVLAATTSLAVPGGRGTLYGLDAADGEMVWSFDTIESEDLWGHPEINSGGGAWYPPAVDQQTGVAYWGTSNPYPFPGAPGFPNGSSRPGDNRWTNSLLAIDYRTGELRWGRQAVAHDLFDRDSVIAAVAEFDGRKVIVNTGKHGRVLGYSEDGEALWETPVGLHQNDDVDSFEGPVAVLPGSVGGVETPIAVADGVVYAAVVNAPSRYSGPEHPGRGQADMGTHNSQLVAVDCRDGEVLWDIELPGDSFGGATTVNDLVFTSMLSGEILAFRRDSGEQVWSYQAEGGINGWPAFAGDRVVVPVSFGDPPHLLALRL